MKLKVIYVCISLLAGASFYSGCKQDVPAIDPVSSGYPDDVAQIILQSCAVRGCHTGTSVGAAAGLDLTTWDDMMRGDKGGAAVIPYSHEYSTLFMFTNTYPDLGVSVEPTMPFNDDPLSREQVITLRNWINAGAPSRDGKIAFSDNPQRKKYYVINQGCDVVTVIDQATGTPMRYIPVGADASIESPHSIRLSPDGDYWYLSFASGRYLEKYRASDDAFVGRILLGPNQSAAFGSWNTFAITPDSRYAFVVHWDPNGPGRIAWVDLDAMTYNQTYQSSALNQTHGSCISPDGNTLYVTTTSGNFIYKFDVSDPTSPSFDQVVIDGVSPLPLTTSSENGHEIAMSPDGTKYFVTASGTNCIRVMNITNDSLIATIPMGLYPLEMAFSLTTPYAYVTCMEDTVTFPGERGSVFAFNWQTNTVIGSVYTGHQPHGVAIDDARELVIVANRNVTPGGPAPHHANACGGRNGYVTFIDLMSMSVRDDMELELSVDPYGCLVR